jgi:glycosyltransferase involved in cell wall biosynthesis
MIKILVVTPNQSGVDLYRLAPHRLLNNELFDVNEIPSIETKADITDKFKPYDIVIMNRSISRDKDDNTDHLIKCIRKAGCKIVLDVDDYWQLPKYHELHKQYEKLMRHRMVKAMKEADAVTCSTQYLADKIRVYNKNVHIIKNCVNHFDHQFMKHKTYSERLRVGFVGGSSHAKDMEYISEQFKKIASLDVDLFYCGYAPSQVNDRIASAMSAKGTNKNFDAVPSLDPNCYGQFYNHLDIAIAPLVKDEFTKSKSELKAIEAGFMGCAFIGANQTPFTYVCNENNSILANRNDWFDAVKYYADNRDVMDRHALQLNADVLEHYNIEDQAKKREELYTELLNDN